MAEEREDSEDNALGEDALKDELTSLVSQKIIPSRIANRLDKKIKEKNVKITKDQLHTLAYKIRDIIKDYAQSSKTVGKLDKTKVEQITREKPMEDMQTLVKTIENLKERISNIESGKTSDLKVVTTEDIKISAHEWEMNPLKEVPNDPESIIVLMKWLQYLLDKCGRDNLSNILDYYVDIGWISEEAKICLIDYSHGITEEKKEGGTIKKDIKNLPSKDHIQSFIFIQKLNGRQFDKHFIDRIDGELARITKKLDHYQFK
jgi:archaellum component FlaD/FlaE